MFILDVFIKLHQIIDNVKWKKSCAMTCLTSRILADNPMTVYNSKNANSRKTNFYIYMKRRQAFVLKLESMFECA